MLLAAPPSNPLARPDGPPPGDAAVERFLTSTEPPLVSAVAHRHMVATTRGGGMTAWLDACTTLDGRDLRYRVVGEGGSGSLRKRALLAALEGEAKARREGDVSRAALERTNYEFIPEAGEGASLRVKLRPRRKDSMLVDGAMTLTRTTGDLLQVEGRLVKPPSFWTRNVDVTRRYARIVGIRVPVSTASKAQVFVMGASTLDITYEYLSINGVPVEGDGPTPADACREWGTHGSMPVERKAQPIEAYEKLGNFRPKTEWPQ